MNNLQGYSKEKEYILRNLKNNSLPNSIILSGIKGVGKKTFIFNLIKEFFKIKLNKEQTSNNLNLINNYIHPNIKYLTKIYDEKEKKNKLFITIDQIRNLHNFLSESSFNGLPKFVIVDSADDLNTNAANGLLKILEEPKTNTHIFLISHQLSSLLPTIRSRCLKIILNNHKYENFKLILNDNLDIKDDETIKFLFDISFGSPGIAIKLLDEDIFNLFNDVLNSLISQNPLSNKTIKLCTKVSNFENDKFKIFLLLLKFILLNLNKSKIGINILNYYLSSKIENLVEASSSISRLIIIKRLEYLIKNENDLFNYNLDKKFFILNFFTIFKT